MTDQQSGSDEETEEHDHYHGAYEIIHTSLTLLVNEANYVERAYRSGSPNPTTTLDDLERVRNN